jgi:hypothetical protein
MRVPRSARLTRAHPGAGASRMLSIGWSAIPSTPRREILLPQSADYTAQQPIRSEARARLLEGIARGRYWPNQLTSGAVGDT